MIETNDEAKSYDSSLDTFNHIRDVQELLSLFADELIIRGINHDDSKLYEPEKPLFDEYTPKLKNCAYGGEEYKQFLSEMKVALDHHYAENSHHPEHYEGGVNDMDLLDIVEMLCDWKAATKRHNNGDILKSLDINAARFSIDDQLKKVLLNTIIKLDLTE